jgi:hypothetical protein
LNAAASPCLARSMASASVNFSPCCFRASVKLPFPAAFGVMRRKPLFVVLLAWPGRVQKLPWFASKNRKKLPFFVSPVEA